MNIPPHKAWYKTRRWQKKRRQQLAKEPLCCMCAEGGRVVPATVADHVLSHKGDPDLFWAGRLQSLCAWHHNNIKTVQDRGFRVRSQQVGTDGWPL